MIRMNPAHDTKTPAGCIDLRGETPTTGTWKNPVLEQEKPLAKAIDEYKTTEAYKQGFNDGWNKAMNAKFPQPTSEFSR